MIPREWIISSLIEAILPGQGARVVESLDTEDEEDDEEDDDSSDKGEDEESDEVEEDDNPP
eukprot:scaffold163215_cov33-Attheya_sp.AAC.3